MRGAGLEPARYFYHEPLKLACLPFHHPRKSGPQSKSRVRNRSLRPGCYLAGAGAAGLGAGIDGMAEMGAAGTVKEGALAGTARFVGTLRPSKILPLMRLVEEYARNS